MSYLFGSWLSVMMFSLTALLVAAMAVKIIDDLTRPAGTQYKLVKFMFQMAGFLLTAGNFILLTMASWLVNHRFNPATGWYQGVSHESVHRFLLAVLAAEMCFPVLWVLAHAVEYFRMPTDNEPFLDMTHSFLTGRP